MTGSAGLTALPLSKAQPGEVLYMSSIGLMSMPPGFKYRDVFLKGPPKHEKYDSFLIRHPRMDVGKRAKIFAPFDALRGFDFVIMCKNELYEDKAELGPEDEAELSRRLEILHNLTWNSRMARANRVQVSVTYYEPCSDENHEDYLRKGQYKTITGTCMNVDAEVTKTILVDTSRIPIADIRRIEGQEGLFERGRAGSDAFGPEYEEGVWNNDYEL